MVQLAAPGQVAAEKGFNGLVTDTFEARVDLVHRATQSTILTVDGLTDSQWREPSLLPGWSRAHVIAHLALNAEGLAGVLHGLRTGHPRPMYRSDPARDQDIERLAHQRIDTIRERFLASTTTWQDQIEHLTPSLRGRTVERTPGGPTFLAEHAVPMRWREVEIHHADLDTAFTHHDWSAPFVDHLLPLVTKDREGEVDLSEISGSPADLAWWLVGRGAGEGLTGSLPKLGPWRRRTSPAAS
jgi:maleylpyruvate isomerase